MRWWNKSCLVVTDWPLDYIIENFNRLPVKFQVNRITSTFQELQATAPCEVFLRNVLFYFFVYLCMIYTINMVGFSRWEAWDQLKLDLTKTMINNARQISRSLVGIYHKREMQLKRFGGRPSVGGRPGTGTPAPSSYYLLSGPDLEGAGPQASHQQRVSHHCYFSLIMDE